MSNSVAVSRIHLRPGIPRDRRTSETMGEKMKAKIHTRTNEHTHTHTYIYTRQERYERDTRTPTGDLLKRRNEFRHDQRDVRSFDVANIIAYFHTFEISSPDRFNEQQLVALLVIGDTIDIFDGHLTTTNSRQIGLLMFYIIFEASMTWHLPECRHHRNCRF